MKHIVDALVATMVFALGATIVLDNDAMILSITDNITQ